MKSNKVKLIKQMKEDAEKNRKHHPRSLTTRISLTRRSVKSGASNPLLSGWKKSLRHSAARPRPPHLMGPNMKVTIETDYPTKSNKIFSQGGWDRHMLKTIKTAITTYLHSKYN